MNFDFPRKIRFECIKCGICCGDTQEKTRHILLLSSEAEEIAASSSQSISEFTNETGGKAPYRYEMKKKPESGKCVFLSGNSCTIYSLRPLICRFYPFELTPIANGRYVFCYTKDCPGIGRERELEKSYFEDLFRLACARIKNYSCSSTSVFSNKMPQ